MGLIILILLTVLVSLWVSSQQDKNRYANNLRVAEQQATIWKDRSGKSHAEIERLQLTNKELRKGRPALVDSIKKTFTGVRPRTITNVITLTTVLHDTVPFPVINPLTFKYQDRWNRYSITPDSSLVVEVRDSMALLSSKKKYGFLNLKSKYTVEAVTFNKKVCLTGLRSVEIIPDRPRRIGLGILAGYGMSNRGLSPTISVGVYYRIL
jgi:hypothetical protein